MKDHFEGKTALQHIAEVQATGISTSLEVHGAEAPGPIFAFLDAAKETTIFLTSLFIALSFFECAQVSRILISGSLLLGWAFWKGARSAWLAWSRLLRLHRVASEEKAEIDRNRGQEREELIALYGAKGFQGPLLDKVVDVLMADQDRLLRVMLQEEMGYRLEESSHPIVQGIWAFFGVVCASIIFLPLSLILPFFVFIGSSLLVMSLGNVWIAFLEKNEKIPAFFWAFVTGVLVYLFVFTVMKMGIL